MHTTYQVVKESMGLKQNPKIGKMEEVDCERSKDYKQQSFNISDRVNSNGGMPIYSYSCAKVLTISKFSLNSGFLGKQPVMRMSQSR